jgi:hypothetical protein
VFGELVLISEFAGTRIEVICQNERSVNVQKRSTLGLVQTYCGCSEEGRSDSRKVRTDCRQGPFSLRAAIENFFLESAKECGIIKEGLWAGASCRCLEKAQSDVRACVQEKSVGACAWLNVGAQSARGEASAAQRKAHNELKVGGGTPDGGTVARGQADYPTLSPLFVFCQTYPWSRRLNN